MFVFKKIIFSLLPLVLGGCLSNHVIVTNSIANENIHKMKQLHVGMTKREVYEIMRYPTVEDQLETAEGNYDVWFYITRANILDQNQYTARNLTPLIFKDGVFIGIGRNYYNQLVEKSKRPQFDSSEPTPVKKDQENVPLEQTLTPSSEQKTPPPQPKPASKQSRRNLSMSSKPKRVDSSKGEQDSSKKSDDDMDEEDQEMLDLEKKENFDDW